MAIEGGKSATPGGNVRQMLEPTLRPAGLVISRLLGRFGGFHEAALVLEA
jgi:hypothetical protein